LVGNVIQKQGAEELSAPLYRAMPRVAADLLRKQLVEIGAADSPSIAPLSILGFMWLTTNGIHNLMDVFEMLVGAKPRPWWRQRLIASGWVLGVLAATELSLTTTWQAAVLAVVAILFYVFVYSMWLKRRTSQNIVWGGLAGCMPVIIGWSAVTGTIGWPAWVFFGVIFFWTPPHTWALAMRYREDYAAAGVPMLPVVATEREVVRQIVLYSWAMVACSLLLMPASSWIYAAVAVPLGLWFLAMAHLLHTRVLRGEPAKPMTLFHISNLYLTGVSVAWAVDSVVGLPVLGWPW
jgi:protoheme IX farnesyltransferase